MAKIQPLSALSEEVQNAWIKQRVTNIIKSYHNAADVIAEPIQNAVDEVLAADGIDGPGQVTVVLDTDQNRISVIDNGRGISTTEIIKYLAPDIGTKRKAFHEGWVRGHKGVGMTFLVYGFDFFELESKTLTGEHYRVRLEGGRSWIADELSDAEPPEGNLEHLQAGEGTLPSHGTRVTIALGPRTEPRELKRAFPTAEFATVALQNQTAIGIVEPPQVRKKRDLVASLEYIADAKKKRISVDTQFRYPHKGLDASLKVFDLDAWFRSSRRTHPAARDNKAYHACYITFGPNELKTLLSEQDVGENLTTVQEVHEYIDQHQVHVYAMFSNSAKYRDRLGELWNSPKNRVLHAPRLRVATDGMISSWSREVTLTHRGFNVDRTWLMYQLRGVEPDMGRKDFPPDLHDFLQLSEDRIANEVATLSKPFLRPSKQRPNAPLEGYVLPAVKAHERRQLALTNSVIPGYPQISFQTEPQCEQDVIALFGELVGLGILRHFRPVFFSGFDYYDSYFDYVPNEVSEIVVQKLPGEHEIDPRDSSGVAEFKLTGDSLLDDLLTGKKRWEDMKFLVCWTVGRPSTEKGGDEITFQRADDSASRQFHGVTHLATLQSAGVRNIFVIALSDLLDKLTEQH
ncbi:ATP-binding protein [Streptomyces sp. NPDC093065]|uniref:ATP-binding protein n=1 Tax=Streptomyces sp. NPDC093065 TaxID=3366021 RepID=UPI0038079F31